MRLEAALARLGSATLLDWLGAEISELLENLGKRQLGSTALAELIVSQRGGERVLRDSHMRHSIIKALREADAVALTNRLGLDPKHPYAVAEHSFRSAVDKSALLDFFDCIAEATIPPPPAITAIEPAQPLFPHQRTAYLETLKYLCGTNNRRVLLHMPTGSGKTRAAVNIVAHFLRERTSEDSVVIWLAYSQELCEQAAEEFSRAWRAFGQRPVTLYRHFGESRCDLNGIKGGLLVASLSLLYNESLVKQEDFLSLGNRTALVVFDEAHQIVAQTYAHLTNLLLRDERIALLGLSATPGRSFLNVGEDIKLARFFNHQKVKLDIPGFSNPIEFLQDKGYLAKVEYETLDAAAAGPLRLTPSELDGIRKGFEISDAALRRLGENSIRNLILIRRLEQELKSAELEERVAKILLFACSVQHSELLAGLLRARSICAHSISSNTPQGDRARWIRDFKEAGESRVMCNFGVLTTGFDAPKTNVAFITRPTNSVVLYSQMIGRATRGPAVRGNAESKVITVKDQIPGFSSIREGFEFWEDIWEDEHA